MKTRVTGAKGGVGSRAEVRALRRCSASCRYIGFFFLLAVAALVLNVASQGLQVRISKRIQAGPSPLLPSHGRARTARRGSLASA